MAFSGGVDSTLLLRVARDIRGADCCAVTAIAPYHLRQELDEATQLADQFNIQHLRCPFDPATVPGLLNNPPERCYLCKKALLARCRTGLPPGAWTLVDGSTLDDRSDHRPGLRAVAELGVRSPLAEAGLTKQSVREISRRLGLSTWNKPAQSCLLTRFPHNHRIEPPALRRVEAAETALIGLTLGTVRVRSLGNRARVECELLERAISLAPQITAACLAAGFETVEIDPAGYRSGSMD